jgi:hypothetical protein
LTFGDFDFQKPAGGVSMFGGAGNPMLAALKKRQQGSDSEVSGFLCI